MRVSLDTRAENKNYAIIDNGDWLLIKSYKWHVMCTSIKSGKKLYAYTNRLGVTSMHRLIMDAKSGQIIDHVNGNGLDNRRSNLRFSSHTLNQINRGKQKNNKSGYKGVCRRRNKWIAQISKNKKHYFLGYFNSKIEAAKAYDAKAKELYNDFARLNFKNS